MTLGQRFFEAVRDAAGIPAGHGSVTAGAGFVAIPRATVDRWHNCQQYPSSAHMARASSVLGLWFCLTVEPDGKWSVWTQDGT